MQIPRAALLVLAVPLVVAACGAPVRTSLPTHVDWGGSSPAAVQTGRLALSGDCVSLVDKQRGAWIVLSQPGSYRSGVAIADSSGKVLARIGDEVSIGGGEYQADSIGSQLVAPIPAACQTDRYWLAGDMTVVGSPAPSLQVAPAQSVVMAGSAIYP